MADQRFRTADVTGLPAFRDSQRWLASPDALAAANKLLHQYGLGANPADVTQDALVAIWHHLAKHPDHSIDNVAGYCRTIMRNVVINTAQGFSAATIDGTTETVDIDDQHMPAENGTLIDDLRTALEARPDAKPWVTAAALNYVTLAAYPSIDTHRARHATSWRFTRPGAHVAQLVVRWATTAGPVPRRRPTLRPATKAPQPLRQGDHRGHRARRGPTRHRRTRRGRTRCGRTRHGCPTWLTACSTDRSCSTSTTKTAAL